MPGRSTAPLSEPQSEAAQAEGRTSFLRLVSHELRTPLNSIIGFSELLSAQAFGPLGASQYAEYAEIIRQSGHKMLKLVNQVIEVVSLRDGVARVDSKPGQAAFIVQDALDLVRAEATEKGVSLPLDEPGAAIWAWFDPRALRTVLVNLLQNAIEASPEGEEVQVVLKHSGPRMLVEVLDRGPGIPDGDIGQVLRPFEAGQYALTRSTCGAGLGLPIAQLLCDRMGAELWVHNRDGGGLAACVALRPASPDMVVRPAAGA